MNKTMTFFGQVCVEALCGEINGQVLPGYCCSVSSTLVIQLYTLLSLKDKKDKFHCIGGFSVNLLYKKNYLSIFLKTC